MIKLDQITEFIVSHVSDNCTDPNIEITPDTEMVESNILDSFAILNLIMTLESELSIKFTPDELADPSIRTISLLAKLCGSKVK